MQKGLVYIYEKWFWKELWKEIFQICNPEFVIVSGALLCIRILDSDNKYQLFIVSDIGPGDDIAGAGVETGYMAGGTAFYG